MRPMGGTKRLENIDVAQTREVGLKFLDFGGAGLDLFLVFVFA
jgi:hypothetical protein